MTTKRQKTEQEINDLLKRIKRKTSLTQEEIAERIGYNRSYISQAKKTDSEKLYTALYREFRAELENLTNVPEPLFDIKQSLEKSIENLTENELRTTAVIERLMDMLEEERGKNKMNPPTLPTPGTPGTETLQRKKKPTH